MAKLFTRFSVLILIIFSAICVSAASADETRHSIPMDPTGFSVLEAEERGTLGMSGVNSEHEEYLNKNVLKFSYTISGAIDSVWANSFPSKFSAKAVDAVRIGVKVPASEQLRQISVNLEIKGKNGVQTIEPLPALFIFGPSF